MRIIIVALIVLIALPLVITNPTVKSLFATSAPSTDSALSTPTTEDACLTTYLTTSIAATAAIAKADAEVARSLDGLLAANAGASAIATATAARIAYDDATAALADATSAFQECARIAD